MSYGLVVTRSYIVIYPLSRHIISNESGYVTATYRMYLVTFKVVFYVHCMLYLNAYRERLYRIDNTLVQPNVSTHVQATLAGCTDYIINIML